MIEFKLPSLGADMDEGKLLEWKVSPGDTVNKGQVVAIVDTSKAAVDVEIWCEGTVFELLVEPGETIPVGTVLATLLEAGESPLPPRAKRVVGRGEDVSCCRFDGHQDWVFYQAGGGSCRDGNSAESSRSRRSSLSGSAGYR